MSMKSPFASTSLPMHLLRGAVGGVALTYALVGHETSALVWAAALGLSIVAFRGCPTCWVSGLFEHLSALKEGREPTGCASGICPAPGESKGESPE